MNNVVSINKPEEHSELFKNNYDFFEYIESYEKNLLSSLEQTYNTKTGRVFHGMISKERCKVDTPIVLTVVASTSFMLSVAFQLWYLIPFAVVFPIPAIFSWKKYLRPENSKTMVLSRVLKKITSENNLPQEHLVSLKSVLKEEDVLELIKKYEKNIPIAEVIEHTRSYFHGFKEYKARQIYININNKK